MVSMKDIANRLKLSRCTVSNILNDRLEDKSYRKETIALVRKTAEEMGYISNNMARSLKTGFTGTIAIVVPDIANTFYIRIIKEVERRATEAGYSLIICIAEEKLDKEKKALTMLQSRCVDGVLISPVSYEKSLDGKYPFKVVCFDRKVKREDYASVLINNYEMGYALTEAILKDGAKLPLFLAGSREDYTVLERYRGFVDALKENDRDINQDHILLNVFDETMSYNAVIKAIDRGVDFDSVYLCSNYYAYGALRALRERNYQVRSVGGFEKFAGMEFLDFKVYVVDQNEARIGEAAFGELLDQLKGAAPAHKILDGNLFQ